MAIRIDNSGAQVPLTLKQGATFGPVELRIKKADGTAYDLTNSTLRGQLRKKALDVDVIAAFAFAVTGVATGLATMTMSAVTTSAIPCGESPDDEASQYTYDVEMVDGVSGAVTALLRGAVTVVREVTR